MLETPKKKPNEEKLEDTDTSSWSDDQRERGYYYDDAHGYETYDPADDASSGGPLDVDLDRTPPLLIESEEAEDKS